MSFTPGYARILQSDYATFDTEALAEFKRLYPNATASQYTAPIADADPTKTWVRVQHETVYNLESLADILNAQPLLSLQDAITAGMQVEPDPE